MSSCYAQRPLLLTESSGLVNLDYEQLLQANEAGTNDLDALLDRAFDSNGLGVLCVTGGSDFQEEVRRIRAELLPLAFALEQLPETAKAAIAEAGTINVNNYSKNIDGNRSGLYFHPSTDTPADLLPAGVHPDPLFYTPNLWPDAQLPGLKPSARAAARFVTNVGRQLALAIDRRCTSALQGYDPGSLARLVSTPECCNHKCRLLCYNQFDTDAARAKDRGMWAPPHKDTGLLTALVPPVYLDEGGSRMETCPDPEVGLYVKVRSGAIVQITAPVGECLLFQVGESLQIVSGGFYHATEHCVRGPPRTSTAYSRTTLAVFFQPHAHEDLPVPRGISLRDIAARSSDGLFKMFLHYQPANATGINFSQFCQREGF